MDQKRIEEMVERSKKRLEERKIKFPVTVTDVKFDVKLGIRNSDPLSGAEVGDMVQIRSCKKEHGDKTRLGILIGFVPIHGGVSFNKETGEMTFSIGGTNPAIYVPELKEVVLGCESWWGVIESEEELKQITDEDINNVWYVQAIKAMAGKKKDED